MKLGDYKDLAQIVAWIAAAAYFTYKAITGYFIGNCSLRLTCSRSRTTTADPSKQSLEHLAIVAVLKRGTGTATFRLHEVRARVKVADGQTVPDLSVLPLSTRIPATASTEAKLIAIERLSSVHSHGVLHAKFQQLAKDPLLNLAPGDETQFATVYEVPAGSVCIVEVVVMGKTWGTGKRSQWRASDISLPQPAPSR